jgi:hypothetical protein
VISTARVYVFNIKYENKEWLSISDCDRLSGQIAQLIKTGIPQFKFKNLQIFNVFKNETCSNEIHFNKIKYDDKRILSKNDVMKLRDDLRKHLNRITQLTYDQILVINDEFSERISPAYLGELNV